jgi:phospholipid transport system substrate-binding protein
MMSIKKTLYLGLAIMLVGAWFYAKPSLAVSDPGAMLSGIADQLIAQLKENKASLSSNPSLVYSLARKIVVPHADISEMSKRVLPPKVWADATPAQKSQFQAEFTTLLVRTYASALAEYKDQTIRFYPVRGGYEGKGSVQVNSVIERSDGPSISVNYRLLLKGSEWRLYDLVVEGVSLLESFRSQFADQLVQGNIGSLVKKLAEHNSGN